MALNMFCMQCGEQGQPVRAISVDDDGEPACGLHRSKNIPIEPVSESRQPVAEVKCKCGCGMVPKRGKEYVWGHKKTSKGNGRLVVKDVVKGFPNVITVEPSEEVVQEQLSKPIQFTQRQLDRLIMSLSIDEKVRLLAGL